MFDYDMTDVNIREYRGFILERVDPYGFWRVSKEKKTPEFFKDQTYTSPNFAKKAVDVFLENVEKTKVDVTKGRQKLDYKEE